MEQNLPTNQNLRQWIKALVVQREALDTQIKAYEAVLAAQSDKPANKQTKRKRSKTAETLKLEETVKSIFQQKGEDDLKQVEILRALIDQSTPEEQMTKEKMQGRFNNLKKSGFLVPSGQYGYYKLGDMTR